MSVRVVRRKDTGKENVIFFGDSISFGELVSPHKNWITRISRDIEEKFEDRFLVINTSINGNTTRMALERMPFDVQKYGVTLLVVQFGMNDCNYWLTDKGVPRVSLEAFRYNLEEIINRGLIFGAKRILLSTSHPTPLTESWPYAMCSYEESRKAYNRVIHQVVTENDCIRLVDIEKAFDQIIANGADLFEYLMADGIHINPKGHEFYYKIFAPVVLEELSRLVEPKGRV